MSVTQKQRALLVISLPPPVTGQSVISATVLDALQTCHSVTVIDTSKQTFRQGFRSPARAGFVFSMLFRTFRGSRNADLAYMVLSQSIAGNLRDLLMVLCIRARRIIVHLHGGGIRKAVFDKSAVLRGVNRLLLRRVDRIIVLSDMLRHQFDGVVPGGERIKSLPNFADGDFFTDSARIDAKYSVRPWRLVFLSNMIESKGYHDLVDAYVGLEPEERRHCTLTLAGAFLDPAREAEFREHIRPYPSIHYLGAVHGKQRTELMQGAHLFILPTYYPYEGQPVSLLEAYASGCVVVTTRHGGIPDVFADPTNGRFVPAHAPGALRAVLRELLFGTDPSSLAAVARGNRSVAEARFTKETFVHDLHSLANDLLPDVDRA